MNFKDQIKNFEMIIDRQLKEFNVKYMVVENAPNNFTDMVNFREKHGYFGIYGGGSDFTIFSSPEYNFKFRALHDMIHFTLGLTFSFKDELKLSEIHANTMPTKILQDILNIEVGGQIKYYMENKRYVVNQKVFMLTELNKLGYNTYNIGDILNVA